MKPVRKVVFPVAGMGTRFLPATKAIPKEMLPIVDKPLIQYAVEEAKDAGIEQFIFVTGRGKHVIEDHFDHAYELETLLERRDKTKELHGLLETLPPTGSVSFTRQQKPRGLGHAVWCARHIVGEEPFAIMLPDDLVIAEPGCLRQMVEAHKKTGGNIVAVREVPREHTSRYGILKVGRHEGNLVEVTGLVEKPRPEDAPSTYSVLGRYILCPEVFAELDKGIVGAGGEIQLTDAMAKLIGRMPFHGLRFDGVSYDCGDKVGYLHANVAIALQRKDIGEAFRDVLKSLEV